MDRRGFGRRLSRGGRGRRRRSIASLRHASCEPRLHSNLGYPQSTGVTTVASATGACKRHNSLEDHRRSCLGSERPRAVVAAAGEGDGRDPSRPSGMPPVNPGCTATWGTRAGRDVCWQARQNTSCEPRWRKNLG
jgi:hypothetical protein